MLPLRSSLARDQFTAACKWTSLLESLKVFTLVCTYILLAIGNLFGEFLSKFTNK